MQAQLDQSDACWQHHQSGTETRDGDDPSKEDEDARRPRTVDKALDTTETKVSAAEQLASAGLHGDAWAREAIAHVKDEVRSLL